MARFELLEKVQSKEALTAEETEEFESENSSDEHSSDDETLDILCAMKAEIQNIKYEDKTSEESSNEESAGEFSDEDQNNSRVKNESGCITGVKNELGDKHDVRDKIDVTTHP